MSRADGSEDGDRTGAAADFPAFYRRHWLPMVRLAGLLVDDRATAEDVVQDAFIAFQRRLPDLRSPGADVAYLRTAVVNGSRSALRRRALWRRHDQPQPAEDVVAAEVTVLAGAAYSPTLAAIRRLPRRQREVLVLRYWQDLPHADIARTLGVTQSTVKSTVSRALDALETILKEDR